MTDSPTLQEVLHQFLLLLQFLERPVVQRQLLGLLAATAMAWLLSDGLWRLVITRRRNAQQTDQPLGWGALLIKFCAFPVLGFGTAWLVVLFLESQGWRAGWLLRLGELFWVLLAYRLAVVILYRLLGEPFMDRYHARLLAPLFWLFVVGLVISNLVDLPLLGRLPVVTVFDRSITVNSLLGGGLAIYFLTYSSWAIQEFLRKLMASHTPSQASMLEAVLTFGRYFVIGLGVLIVAGALGLDLSTIALISGGLSVGIGLGLQKIASNFISGIILLFEQSIRPGDVVTMEGQVGVIDALNIRAATVRTYDNVELIVPNEQLMTSTVTSYTKSSPVVRLVLLFRASYASDPETVMQLLLEAATAHPDVLSSPAPAVFLRGYDESALNFRLHVWIADMDYYFSVPNDLYLSIWQAFQEHGIEVPYPQRDIHLRGELPGFHPPAGHEDGKTATPAPPPSEES